MLRISLLIGLTLAVLGAAQSSAPPAWQPGTAYAVGDVVSHGNVVYKCLQAHTSQLDWTPVETPALWSNAELSSSVGSSEPVESSAPATAAPTEAPSEAPSNPPSSEGPTSSPPRPSPTTVPVEHGNGCGWRGLGTSLNIAADLDVCLPPVVCTSETCPPSLGSCVDGVCQYKNGYKGLETFPEAWSTYYCTLSTGGCHGVTQINFPEVTADLVASALHKPLCEGYTGNGTCIGIAASSPMIVGNSQEAIDPATNKLASKWGLGFTEASGLCYAVTGPGGTAVVALTDRCGGYCKCAGSGYQECGPCVSAPDMQPNCACVGAVPGVFGECCGNGCATTEQACDWCASNNHPHFDFDTGTFTHVCGSAGIMGSCRLSKIEPVACLEANAAWPPGGAGGASCPTDTFNCNGVAPTEEQPVIPDSPCCCNWGLKPQSDGTCK